MREGTYFIATASESKRPRMFKAVSEGKFPIEAKPIFNPFKTRNDLKGKISIARENILCVLGTEPVGEGKTFAGVKVLIPRGRELLENIGYVYNYRAMEDDEIKSLKKGLFRAYDGMKAKGLDVLFPMEFRITPKKGKYAGQHVCDELGHIVWLFPKEIEADKMQGLIYHEFGHAVWVFMRKKEKRKWVSMYHKHVQPSEISPANLKKVLDIFIEYGNIEGARESMDDDQKDWFGAALDWIEENHCLDREDVDVLDPEDLTAIWPTKALTSGESEEWVTDYARKNTRELFAESFSLWMLGSNQLPSEISDALRRHTGKVVERFAHRK